MNYEQHLVACILTAAGPKLTLDDIDQAFVSAERVIRTMANHQVSSIKEIEVNDAGN